MKTKKPQDRPDLEVLTTVFIYCIAIIVCPVATFFGSKILIFEGVLGLNNVVVNVYSAVAAVLVLHIALGFFIYRAYTDPSQTTHKPDKRD